MSKAAVICEVCKKAVDSFCPICQRRLSYYDQKEGVCYHCKGATWKLNMIATHCLCSSVQLHFIRSAFQ